MSALQHSPCPSSSTVSSGARECILQPGQVLASRWRVERLVGWGGMALVYAATDVQGRRGAIKVLREPQSKPARERLLHEATVASSVQHPAMVRTFGTETATDGSPCLVMELLDGVTLEALAKHQRRPLSAALVLEAMEAVLDLLVLCHERGITHRDIKPANIVLTREGLAKLLDFGVAHVQGQPDPFARPGTAIGTPSFMPPEQAMGAWDQVDATADLFAVGASIFALVSGVRLHQGSTEADSFVLASTRAAPSLGSVWAQAPHGLCELVDRALRWNKRARFVSAQEMLESVRALRRKLGHANPPLRECVTSALATRESPPGCLPELEHAIASEPSRLPLVLGKLADELAGAGDELVIRVHPYGLDLGPVRWAPAMDVLPAVERLFDLGIRAVKLPAHAKRDQALEVLQALLLSADRGDDAITRLWALQLPERAVQFAAEEHWAAGASVRMTHDLAFGSLETTHDDSVSEALAEAWSQAPGAEGWFEKTVGAALETPLHEAVLRAFLKATKGPGATEVLLPSHPQRQALLQACARMLDQPAQSALAEACIRTMMRELDGALLEEVLQATGDAPARFANVVEPYLRSHLAGNEPAFGRAAATARPAHAKLLVHILAEHCSPQATDQLEHLSRTASAYAQAWAMFELHGRTEALTQHALQMLDDEDEEVRIAAADMIGELAMADAAGPVWQRLGHPIFHELSLAERQVLLRSAARIDEKPVERACMRLVQQHGLITDPRQVESRVLAAEFLAQHAASQEALQALRRATARMWWNPAPVREAAQNAITSIEQRLSGTAGEASHG